MSARAGSRQGVAIALVLLAALLVGGAVMTFLSTVLQEGRQTARMMKQIRAEAIAESAVARLASLVNQRAWEDRFYLTHAIKQAAANPGVLPEPVMPFTHDAPPFSETGPEYASGAISFSGAIKDVNTERRLYHVRVLVNYQGYQLLGLFDLKYAEGVLRSASRDPVWFRVVKSDGATPGDDVDQELEAIHREKNLPQNVLDNPAEANKLNNSDPRNPQAAERWIAPLVAQPIANGFDPGQIPEGSWRWDETARAKTQPRGVALQTFQVTQLWPVQNGMIVGPPITVLTPAPYGVAFPY